MNRLSKSLKPASKRITTFLNDMNGAKSNSYLLILTGIIFILMLFYTFQRANTVFFYDSDYYWQLADSFSYNGFSFTSFSDKLRGYLFPFLLFTIKAQANLINIDSKLVLYGYSSLFFTLLSVHIIPWACRNIFHWNISLFGRLVVALFIFYFWRGHFLYPLSDFPAFTSLLIGVTLFAMSLKSKVVSYLSIFIGVFIGAAINIRPVYLVSFMIIFPFLFVHAYSLRKGGGVKLLFLFFLGAGLVLLPQLQINQTQYNISSPLVLAKYSGDENLYEKQLFWGLGTQKYETTIDPNYHSIILVYEDPFNTQLKKTNLLREKTFSRYIKIAKRFPLEISVSYFRHFFNGLDIFFSTPIVKNIYTKHTLLSTINYLVWFLVISFLMETNLAHLDYQKMLCLLSLLAPVALAIPTAIEVRFFLPVHLLAYGVVGFGIDLVGLFKALMKNKWDLVRFIITGALWLILCFTLSMATIENLVP